MDPAPRYLIAALAAALLTGGVTLAPDDTWSVSLLAGIGVATFVATAYALKCPEAFGSSGESPDWTAGAFGGVAAFGSLSLMTGLDPTPHVGAGVLGLALAWVGFTTGVAHERE